MADSRDVRNLFSQFGNIDPIVDEVMENFDDRTIMFEFKFYAAPDDFRILRVPVPKIFARRRFVKDLESLGWRSEDWGKTHVYDHEGFTISLTHSLSSLDIYKPERREGGWSAKSLRSLLLEKFEEYKNYNLDCKITQSFDPYSKGWSNVVDHLKDEVISDHINQPPRLQKICWKNYRHTTKMTTPFAVPPCNWRDTNLVRLRVALGLNEIFSSGSKGVLYSTSSSKE